MNESTGLVIHVRYKNVNEVLASRSENFLKFFSIKYQFIIFKNKKTALVGAAFVGARSCSHRRL